MKTWTSEKINPKGIIAQAETLASYSKNDPTAYGGLCRAIVAHLKDYAERIKAGESAVTDEVVHAACDAFTKAGRAERALPSLATSWMRAALLAVWPTQPSTSQAEVMDALTKEQVDWLMTFNARLIVDGLHPEDARLWMRANDQWDFDADPVAEADSTWQDFFANPDDDGPVDPPIAAKPEVQRELAVALPMSAAPRDGSMLRLLVQFDEHATEDTTEPAWTIGSNSFDANDIDEWQFAGWCWSHDHFTEGKGTPVGWLPMLGSANPAEPAQAAQSQDGFLPNGTRVMWQSSNGTEFPATITAYNPSTYDAVLDDGCDAKGFVRERFKRINPAKPELQGGDDVRATVNGIMKSVCESDPADPEAPNTVCVDVLDLRLILLQHLAAQAEPAQAAHEQVESTDTDSMLAFMAHGQREGLNLLRDRGRFVNTMTRAAYNAWMAAGPVQAAQVDDAAALAHFTDYFARNYPGPNTIIGNPMWHAPKIFRAAKYAIEHAAPTQAKDS